MVATDLDFDVIIIGAGISGLYQLHLLRQRGLRVRVFEAGTGVGGVWYWNRYPGARFDSESWSYGYSFSQDVLDEWDWTEHFAPQPETERYLNFVADKFDLRRDIQFRARVEAAHWDGGARAWAVTLADGSTLRCRFLIPCVGPLSAPTFPRFEGIEEFAGEWFHTGLWPKQPVTFAGKRVAVVGTGASGVQAIPEAAKTAAHLTVFQRRPNWATPLHNAKISSDEMDDIRARYPEIFEHCKKTPICFIHRPDRRHALEVSAAERQAFWEQLYATPGFGIWVGNFRDVLTDREANRQMSAFVANKIRQRVRDPRTAELLIPKDHGFGTRRVPQETFYYEAYNRPNVELVSMLETPVLRVTPKGIRTTAAEYEFDMIIYATGFDAITGSLDRIDISGVGGQRLYDKWRRALTSYVGIFADGFPNMFMVMGPHSQLGNIPRSIEHVVEWIDGLIGHLTANGLTYADAREGAVAEWMAFVEQSNEGLLTNEVDSWMTGVNMNVEGKQNRIIARYSGTARDFRDWCQRVKDGGYRELDLS